MPIQFSSFFKEHFVVVNKIIQMKPIKTEKEYQEALKRMEELFDSPEGSNEGDEAEVLSLLIDEYEKENFPIESPDPIEAIKIRMEELNLKQIDLVPSIGGKSRVSEVLNRKRKLTVGMIRELTKKLDLPAELLIRDYPTSRIKKQPSKKKSNRRV